MIINQKVKGLYPDYPENQWFELQILLRKQVSEIDILLKYIVRNHHLPGIITQINNCIWIYNS